MVWGGGGVCVRACVRARTVSVDAKFESVLNVISFTVIRAPAWSRPVTSTAVVIVHVYQPTILFLWLQSFA